MQMAISQDYSDADPFRHRAKDRVAQSVVTLEPLQAEIEVETVICDLHRICSYLL